MTHSTFACLMHVGLSSIHVPVRLRLPTTSFGLPVLVLYSFYGMLHAGSFPPITTFYHYSKFSHLKQVLTSLAGIQNCCRAPSQSGSLP